MSPKNENALGMMIGDVERWWAMWWRLSHVTEPNNNGLQSAKMSCLTGNEWCKKRREEKETSLWRNQVLADRWWAARIVYQPGSERCERECLDECLSFLGEGHEIGRLLGIKTIKTELYVFQTSFFKSK